MSHFSKNMIGINILLWFLKPFLCFWLEDQSVQEKEKKLKPQIINLFSQKEVLNEPNQKDKSTNSPKPVKIVSSFPKKTVSNKIHAKIKNFNGKMCSINNQFCENLKKSLSGSLNSLRKIIVLIRCAKVLRFRTKFRDLRFVNKKQVDMISDVTHFPEKKQHNILFYQRFTEKNVRKIKTFFCFFFSITVFCQNLLYLHELSMREFYHVVLHW